MSTDRSPDGFSTVADFELLAAGRSYDVGQVADTFIILETPAEIPPCRATLVIRIEGREIRRDIELVEGATASSARVRIEREPPPSAS